MSPADRRPDIHEPWYSPTAKWVCGHKKSGFSCASGPTASGECGSERKPCSADPKAVGATIDNASRCLTCTLVCHQRANAVGNESPWMEFESAGLSTCIPVRSGWSFRSNLALNLAIATAAAMLLLMALPPREAAFVPGGLSSKHAQILDNKIVAERCSVCHPTSHATSLSSGQITTQDDLCTRCHQEQLPNLKLRSPHDLDRVALRHMTVDSFAGHGRLVSTKQASLRSIIQSFVANDTVPSGSSESKTTCASCHGEHHGRGHDLQAISDQRCQACHVAQFADFVNGHPDFKDYPEPQPRRIAFNHQAHLQDHFAKRNESFECAKCHLDSNQRGGVGSVFRSLSFETACARCHADAIHASAIDGWVLLQLPSIQPADVKQLPLHLTDWPSSAQFGYEGSIPLVMRSLLMADPNVQTSLGLLPASGEIGSIADFANFGREASISFATGTRALIRDIATSGQIAWHKRLESVLRQSLARELVPSEMNLLDELCSGLPPDIFRQMEQNWFSGSDGGIASRLQNELETAHLISNRQENDLLLDFDASKGDDENALSGNAQQATSPTDTAGPTDELLLPWYGNRNLLNDEGSSARNPQKLTKLRGAVHVVQGGWYLDNETLSLRYMPRGHSDRTLAAWSEFTHLLSQATDHHSLAKQVPGGCTQCHVLGGSSVDSANIWPKSSWTASNKPATTRTITKFDHSPHLSLPVLSDCKYCHQLQATKAKKSPSRLTSTFGETGNVSSLATVGEFKSLQVQQCTACHRPNAASTGCVQCHNYHVTAPTPVISTSIEQ